MESRRSNSATTHDNTPLKGQQNTKEAVWQCATASFHLTNFSLSDTPMGAIRYKSRYFGGRLGGNFLLKRWTKGKKQGVLLQMGFVFVSPTCAYQPNLESFCFFTRRMKAWLTRQRRRPGHIGPKRGIPKNNKGCPLGQPLCDTDRTQTCNLLIRSQMLYSIKLRCRIAIANVGRKWELCKLFEEKIL